MSADALVAWVRLFEDVDGTADVATLEDLSNGLVLAGIFSDMHPRHAIPSSMLYTQGNWVLQKGNLDEVVSGLQKVYRRFDTEGLVIAAEVDTDEIAENKDVANLEKLLGFLLTSMFTSPRVEALGEMITPLAATGDAHIPEQLMAVMQQVQEEWELDPSDLLDDEDEDSHDHAPPLPTAAAPATAQEAAQRAMGHAQTAADYEEVIEAMEERVKSQKAEIAQLHSIAEQHCEEKAAAELKYQQLYDKHLASRSTPEETADAPSSAPSASLDKLHAELTNKDAQIADLEKKVSDYLQKEKEWASVSDELQIAQFEIAEARREAEKAAHIREQRETATQERNFYKQSMETAETKLDEEVARAAKLARDLERAGEKLKKAEETNAEKLLLDVKLQDTLRRLEEAEQEARPVQDELTAAQRSLRQLASENTTLKEDLEAAKEAGGGGGGGSSLADELGGPKERDEVLALKKELATVRDALEERDEALERAEAAGTKAKDHSMGLLEQVADLRAKLEEAEAAAGAPAEVPEEVAAQLRTLERELKVKAAACQDAERELLRARDEAAEAKATQALAVETLTAKLAAAEEKAARAAAAAVPAAAAGAAAAPLREQAAAPSANYAKQVQQDSEEVRMLRAGLDQTARSTEKKEKEFKEKYAKAKKETQKELQRISSSFYQMGKMTMNAQLNHLGSSKEPQSWLAKKKHEAHSFTPAKHP